MPRYVLRWRNQRCGKDLSTDLYDSYSKVAMAKLYDRKNVLVAAYMLNNKVIP